MRAPPAVPPELVGEPAWPERGAPAARPPARAPPAAPPPSAPLLAAGLLLCGSAAAGLTAGRACAEDEAAVARWGRQAWKRGLLAVPLAALLAWCAWRRGHFRPGEALHAWTWRFAVAAAVDWAAEFWMVPLELCGGSSWRSLERAAAHLPWQTLALTALLVLVIEAAHMAQKVILVLLLEHKLRALGRAGLARGVRFCAACLPPAHTSLLVLEVVGPVSDLPEAALTAGSLMAILFFLVGFLGPLCLGLWGLGTSAARVSRSASRARRRAASWVALTAAALAGSTVSWGADLVVGWTFGLYSTERTVAKFADLLLDCAGVAVFSGLAGPRGVRQLAERAFAVINSYTPEQLQQFYEEFLRYLDEAEIKFVRCRFLRRLAAEGATMPRCQEVPGSEAVVGSRGFPPSRLEDKHRFVVSHPWLAKGHPDPQGKKMQVLVQQLDALGAADDDAVFVDYMSIPQHNMLDPNLQRLEGEGRWPEPGSHPAVRSAAEEATFKKALGSMELLYSVGKTPVIVLPMDQLVDQCREYISRGWCFLEFNLSLSFGNIANADAHPPVNALCERARTMETDTVEGFRVAFDETSFTDSGDADLVMRLFTQTVTKGRRGSVVLD